MFYYCGSHGASLSMHMSPVWSTNAGLTTIGTQWIISYRWTFLKFYKLQYECCLNNRPLRHVGITSSERAGY